MPKQNYNPRALAHDEYYGLSLDYPGWKRALEEIPKNLAGYWILSEAILCGLRETQRVLHMRLQVLEDKGMEYAVKLQDDIRAWDGVIVETIRKLSWMVGKENPHPIPDPLPESWLRLKEEITPEEKDRIRQHLEIAQDLHEERQADPRTAVDEEGTPIRFRERKEFPSIAF
jgi:hypothetical protein